MTPTKTYPTDYLMVPFMVIRPSCHAPTSSLFCSTRIFDRQVRVWPRVDSLHLDVWPRRLEWWTDGPVEPRNVLGLASCYITWQASGRLLLPICRQGVDEMEFCDTCIGLHALRFCRLFRRHLGQGCGSRESFRLCVEGEGRS